MQGSTVLHFLTSRHFNIYPKFLKFSLSWASLVKSCIFGPCHLLYVESLAVTNVSNSFLNECLVQAQGLIYWMEWYFLPYFYEGYIFVYVWIQKYCSILLNSQFPAASGALCTCSCPFIIWDPTRNTILAPII